MLTFLTLANIISGCLISRLASDLCDPTAITIAHDSKLVVSDRKAVKVYQIDYEYNVTTLNNILYVLINKSKNWNVILGFL